MSFTPYRRRTARITIDLDPRGQIQDIDFIPDNGGPSTTATGTLVGFDIEQQVVGGAWSSLGQFDDLLRTHTATGLTANTDYNFRIRAVNDDDTVSTWVTASARTDPPAGGGLDDPTDFRVATSAATQQRLEWTYSGSGHDVFQIERNEGTGSYGKQVSVSAADRSVLITGLQPATFIQYRIRAYSSSDVSAWVYASGTTSEAGPPTLTDPSITALGPTSAVLRAYGDGNGGVMYAAVRTSGPYGPDDQNLVRDGTDAAWNRHLANAWKVSFLIDGLSPSTAYHYGVFVAGANGEDGSVLTGSFVTLAEVPDPVGGGLLPRERI